MDQKLGVSDKAKALSDAVGSKVSALDESLQLSQKAKTAASAADSMFGNLAKAASTTFEGFVNKGVTAAQTHFPNAYQKIQNAGESMSHTISSVKAEADQKYAEQKAAESGYAPVPVEGQPLAEPAPLMDLSEPAEHVDTAPLAQDNTPHPASN